MAPSKLHNYLATHRKHTGLSQREVAWIIELNSEEEISRYEAGERLPSLTTVLRLEVLYGVPSAVLFSGYRQRLARRVEHRILSHYWQISSQPIGLKSRKMPGRAAALRWHIARRNARTRVGA